MCAEHLSSASASVRVLVVDDQQLIREGICSLLSIQEGISVVGSAANGLEALERAREHEPEVILMDLRMPIMDGVAATAELLRQHPSCCVLMLTTFDDEQYITTALQAGAQGYLLKDMPSSELARAIILAHAGIFQLDGSVASKLVSALTPSRTVSTGPPQLEPLAAHGLTTREIEVLRSIAQGATNREIATELMVSEGTVKNHISHILTRLDLRDRTQAALFARDRGLI